MEKGRISQEETDFGACQMLMGRVLRSGEEGDGLGWDFRQSGGLLGNA